MFGQLALTSITVSKLCIEQVVELLSQCSDIIYWCVYAVHGGINKVLLWIV